MKMYAKILIAVAFALGLSGRVKAAAQDGIIVKLPFQFVADGKSLPAGTYTASRLSNDKSGPLILTSKDNGTSVFVLPYESESASANKPQVSFQRAGDQNFLAAIQTPEETYHFHVSQMAIMEAAARLRNNSSISGGSD